MTEIRNRDWFVVFRILFGCLAAFSSLRFFLNGWINDLYVVPTFHFTFGGFGWVKVLSPKMMYLSFAVMVVCGIAIAFN